MSQKAIFVGLSILVITMMNYCSLVFYIFFGLLTICATSFGPAIIFYAYTRLSKEYTDSLKYLLPGATLLLLSVLFYYDLIFYAFFGSLAICGMIVGPTMVLYIHSNISHSSANKSVAKNPINKLNAFEILLIVSFLKLFFKNIKSL